LSFPKEGDFFHVLHRELIFVHIVEDIETFATKIFSGAGRKFNMAGKTFVEEIIPFGIAVGRIKINIFLTHLS
jgi:hypothetical protein